MSWLILVVCASILSLSAGQSPFNEGIAVSVFSFQILLIEFVQSTLVLFI
jgi:hypothetical protein